MAGATPSVWQALARRFRVDLFCGLYMSSFNDGFLLAPDVLLLLGERGILLDCDIYGVGEPGDSTEDR